MQEFKDKKIAVLGFGVEGLSTTRFLAKKGASITVCDQKEKSALEQDFLKEAESLGVSLNLGQSYLGDLEGFDYIFRSPGVKRTLPEILKAENNGVKITSQTILFLEEFSEQTVGVTGTKGKGTTATLIAEILKNAGNKVFLGGNIGKPPLEFFDEMTSESVAVLELSSYQLQDCQISPHVGVVLMITSEHLDYHASTEEYIEAKKNIISFQTEKDFAIINADYPISKSFDGKTKGAVYYFSKKQSVEKGAYIENNELILKNEEIEKVLGVKEISLLGEHNWENVAAAVAATAVYKVNLDSVRDVLRTFKGLEHRLELVKTINGAKYYNDTFSTTPETAIAAIRSFTSPEIVILGGSSKGSKFEELGEEIVKRENIKAIILIGVEGPRIETAIKESQVRLNKGSSLKLLKGPKNISEIVQTAFMIASVGDVVLLSPACASFDMFKNYKHRGEEFKKEVNRLSEDLKESEVVQA